MISPTKHLLLDLSESSTLVRGTLVRRPSARNKSPYVGDVALEDGRVALAHLPSLDLGGKCVAGSEILLKAAVDRKGVPIGADAVSPKYGTPKCEFIAQLVWVKPARSVQAHVQAGEEGASSKSSSSSSSSSSSQQQGGVWVGAHPSLGETLAAKMLEDGLLDECLGMPVASFKREVKGIAGDASRADFVVTHQGDNAGITVLEVKTVVDADQDAAMVAAPLVKKVPACASPKKALSAPPPPPPAGLSTPQRAPKRARPGGRDGDYDRSVDVSSPERSRRATAAATATTSFAISSATSSSATAVFPWGGGKQKGPDGEKVVSSRAIKHVDELAALARGDRKVTVAQVAAVVAAATLSSVAAVGAGGGGSPKQNPPGPSSIANTSSTTSITGSGGRSDGGGEDDSIFVPTVSAAVLFVVVRGDVASFRPHHEACPSFAAHLAAAHRDGVKVISHRVVWGDGGSAGTEGQAAYGGPLPVLHLEP
jgi:DNA-binding sugar fermentation-stimulating protein